MCLLFRPGSDSIQTLRVTNAAHTFKGNGISRYHDMKHLGRDTSKNSKESRLTLGCHCWCLSQLSWKSSPVGMEHYGTMPNRTNMDQHFVDEHTKQILYVHKKAIMARGFSPFCFVHRHWKTIGGFCWSASKIPHVSQVERLTWPQAKAKDQVQLRLFIL